MLANGAIELLLGIAALCRQQSPRVGVELGVGAVTIVVAGTSARDALLAMNATPGRPGAAVVVTPDGVLTGFFTDGDLARNLQADIAFLERPIDEVMIQSPLTIGPERLASEALRLLRERRVDQIPVTDESRRPIGLIDVQDMLAARIV